MQKDVHWIKKMIDVLNLLLGLIYKNKKACSIRTGFLVFINRISLSKMGKLKPGLILISRFFGPLSFYRLNRLL